MSVLASHPHLLDTYLGHELDRIVRDYAAVGVDPAHVRARLRAVLSAAPTDTTKETP